MLEDTIKQGPLRNQFIMTQLFSRALSIALISASVQMFAGDANWGRIYRLHLQGGLFGTGSPTQFHRAVDGDGYLMIYDAMFNSRQALATVRIDAHGNASFSAFLYNDTDPVITRFGSSQGDVLFTGYSTSSGTAVLGVNAGANLTPKFGISVPISDPSKVAFHYFPDGYSALLENRSDGVSVMVLTPAGAKIIDHLLQPAGLSQSPKWMSVRRLTGSAGFQVMFTDYVVKIPGTSPVNPTLFTMRLYLARFDQVGNYVGTTQVSYDTEGVAPPSFAVGSSDEALFVFIENTIDRNTYGALTRSRLLCMNGDGTRIWSGISENAYFDSVEFGDGSFWLGGSWEGQGTNAATILRINPVTGSPQGLASLALNEGGGFKVIGFYQNRLYGLIRLGLSEYRLCSLDASFANPSALRIDSNGSPVTVYIEPSENRLLFHTDEGVSGFGAVTAIDPGLVSIDECGRLQSATVALWANGPSVGVFVPTVASISTSVSGLLRAPTEIMLPLFVPDIDIRKICGPEELKPVVLSIELKQGPYPTAYRLRFETDLDTIYFLDFSTNLNEGYFNTESWNGTGWSRFVPLPELSGQQKYFRLRALRPE